MRGWINKLDIMVSGGAAKGRLSVENARRCRCLTAISTNEPDVCEVQMRDGNVFYGY